MRTLLEIYHRDEEEPVVRAFVVIEKGWDGAYTAYCDELRCVASGATEDEAMENLMDAIRALLEEYGEEIRKEQASKTYRLIEV